MTKEKDVYRWFDANGLDVVRGEKYVVTMKQTGTFLAEVDSVADLVDLKHEILGGYKDDGILT